MSSEAPRARIAYQGSALSRAKQLALKTFFVLGGSVVLAGAFFVSLIFVAIGLVVLVSFGGYLWWKTRELRGQLRARMEEQQQPAGRIFEGEVISREREPKHRESVDK